MELRIEKTTAPKARPADESKLGFCKIQIAFASPPDPDIWKQLNILQRSDIGSVTSLIVRGNSTEAAAYLETFNPLLSESVPLTLEEVFIHEMEVAGYDYSNILF